jgi:anti-sigma regulatory factor (Ser/Thr protein kinase)
VANRGRVFNERDVNAIMNLATSGKEIGEGIGNKGLGFRSIEAISDDVRIYSRSEDRGSSSFDGYCSRSTS